ncbi:MAG TPA: dienelactone hydrolase family protein [Dehalococcoidia bacterium]|nr:dienelactone hydrolase family protein [Dehalococcoidia bacterium]
MAGRWETVTVPDAPDMRCYVALPSDATPRPAVAVAQHAGGVDDFIRTMTERFAEAGFVAIAPDLYHREDVNSGDDAMRRMSRLRDANIVADMDAAIGYVRTLPEVRAQSIGVTGFCMGGRVAYLMATRMPDLRAAVVFYGGNIMVPWGEGPAPFEGTAQIACPVLGLFGADDPNPSQADVSKLDAELSRHGKVHEFHSYPGAGHAFMNEGRPSFREEAARDAWGRCIAWFERHLAP